MDSRCIKLKPVPTGNLLWRLCCLGLCLLACGTQAVFGTTILPATAFWHVYDISGSQDLGGLQAPFGYATTSINPLVKTPWDDSGSDPVWAITNTIDLTGVTLATVEYSTAIDNDYQLFVNGQSIETVIHDGPAQWSSPITFPSGSIHTGNNEISLLITNRDGGSPSYFSMKITADGCADVPELGSEQISSNFFSFGASGQAGASWNVYSSTDLVSWTSVSGITLDGIGEGSFTDNTITGVPYRFYKLSDNGSNCCSQVVGFYRVQVSAGTTNSVGTNGLLALQLDSEVANTLDGLFNRSGAMPDGTPLPNDSVFIKWDDASQVFKYYTWNSSTGWQDSIGNPAGSVTWDVGEGAYLAASSAVTVTFVGSVRDGILSRSLTGNGALSHLIGSMLPKAGGLKTDLSYVAHAGDEAFLWTGSGTLTGYTYLNIGGPHWNPQEPVLNVGQGFFWRGAVNNTWQMNFFPCQ